ncbi:MULTISPECIES: CbiX/SirB N-terminal domain-containing protein [Sorangium]|uniref:Sirohydrochlorin cobaltochelatase n=1 Tax=Sorangium cellulosum (strain So ce56) TaxID=448385 RepID=A9GQ78_SORC5|nr:CbiX/SirB N-terminal domain-containing protein [Sorangium cellulosum]CAN90402.1 sirohydrochlorin cobaltochelatase [Sorangium cellulosum So ce56]
MHDDGLLLIGHGSRDAASNAEFEAIVADYAAARPGIAVQHGYIELATPHLADALAALAARVSRVAVVPLFLFAAGHVKNDIPIALERARAAHPGVRFSAARPLGVHPALAEIAFERAATALPDDPAARARSALVVVGRGSSDPDANGDFCKTARLIGEGRGLQLVEPTFIGVTRPSVEETLERVARHRPERVVVVPYFLFAGRLMTKLAEQVDRFSSTYPWIRASLAPHLGRSSALEGLIDERARQAFAGEAPLPCDTCMYRTALPGLAREVGGLKAMLYSVRHTLTHTQASNHPHAHRSLRKHVLVCGNADCVDRGSLALLESVRRLVKQAGQQQQIRVTRTSCMGRCGEGPTVAVYPDGVWYRGVRDEDAKDLVEEHLLGDRLVARLVDDIMQ